MLSNDTNNIYHSIITNLLITIFADGKDPENEALFTKNDLFAKWFNTIAHAYNHSANATDKWSSKGKCYFGHIFKLIKIIHAAPNNFLQRSIDEGNKLVKEAWELFYTPKCEIDKREYYTPSDDKSEIFDNESEKFEEIFEVEMEKSDLTEFSGNHSSSEESPIVERDLNSPLVVDEQEAPQDEMTGEDGACVYNDLNYWKTHIKFEEQNIYDLLR
jgi:hypothetical protein